MQIKVIKNGKEEIRDVDYHAQDLYESPTLVSYPVLSDNEHCAHTFDGNCYVWEFGDV